MTTAAELNETAASLAKAIASFDRLVAAEALKQANKLAVQYAKAADERIDDVTKKATAEIQRRDDDIVELRRQLAVANGRLNAVRLCRVWHDDLGRGYVFADELAHAAAPGTYAAPVPARIGMEN